MQGNYSAYHCKVFEATTPATPSLVENGEQLYAVDPLCSIAISLKRIANALEAVTDPRYDAPAIRTRGDD